MNVHTEYGQGHLATGLSPIRQGGWVDLTLRTPAGNVRLKGVICDSPDPDVARQSASCVSIIVDGLQLIASPGPDGGVLAVTYQPLPIRARGPAFELSATLEGIAQVYLAHAIMVETVEAPRNRRRLTQLHEQVGNTWVRVRDQQFDGVRVRAWIQRMGRYRFE